MSTEPTNFAKFEAEFDEAAREAGAFVKERPLLSVLIAFMAGLLIAWIFTPKGRS